MIVETQNASFDISLSLESGRVLEGFELAYETYGTLNAAATNAVLICHGLTANAHAAGLNSYIDDRPGWWDKAIGSGKPFDTDRYFVVCSNVLGGSGGSTGPASFDPESGRAYGLSFPVLTIGDMVAAQVHLAGRLGIEKFLCVAGGCMGGFQALEWMSKYPERMASAIVISATPSISTHSLGLWEVMRQALMRDPAFNGGNYYEGERPNLGVGLSAMFGMMIWMSPRVMAKRFGLNLAGGRIRPSYSLEAEFEIQQFLHTIDRNARERLDANSFIYLTKAMDYFDLRRNRKKLSEAFLKLKASTLLVSYHSDWRYPPEEVDAIRTAIEELGLPVHHSVLESPFGHGAFIYDSEGVGELIRLFLNEQQK